MGMNLFRKAGERFEETKRSLMGQGEIEFHCTACDTPVTQDYDECPHCGEDAVVPVE